MSFSQNKSTTESTEALRATPRSYLLFSFTLGAFCVLGGDNYDLISFKNKPTTEGAEVLRTTSRRSSSHLLLCVLCVLGGDNNLLITL